MIWRHFWYIGPVSGIKYIAIEVSLLFMIYDNLVNTKVAGESSNCSGSIINCYSNSSSCAAVAVVLQQLMLQKLQQFYLQPLPCCALCCLVIWRIIGIHLWAGKYVNMPIDWCCCFQCCCFQCCYSFWCCNSWNCKVTLGLWWPCSLCNNTFSYRLQISQNGLSTISVYGCLNLYKSVLELGPEIF